MDIVALSVVGTFAMQAVAIMVLVRRVDALIQRVERLEEARKYPRQTGTEF